MTVDKCKSHCRRKGYNYAGVEVRVECWCGNVIPTADKELEPKECYETCMGNSGQMCGAPWRINIYSIGPKLVTVDSPYGQANNYTYN